ncbi:MAG: VWA domain-containing protein, partial [Deltaproteobacteria bacterium]|nr:VWA domain-containing protein [Deltaproteobacteria bacterium]
MKRSLPESLGALAIGVSTLALVLHLTPDAPTEPLKGVQQAASKVVAAVRQPAPRVEVVFVLDTTGSMRGLVEGAKRKIWSVANRIASGDPQPDVRIGLVAYRDRGDPYITQSFTLDQDLDQVYAHLLGLQT